MRGSSPRMTTGDSGSSSAITSERAPQLPLPACTQNRVYPILGPYQLVEVGNIRLRLRGRPKRGRVRGTLHESSSPKKPLTPPLTPQERSEGDQPPAQDNRRGSPHSTTTWTAAEGASCAGNRSWKRCAPGLIGQSTGLSGSVTANGSPSTYHTTCATCGSTTALRARRSSAGGVSGLRHR